MLPHHFTSRWKENVLFGGVFVHLLYTNWLITDSTNQVVCKNLDATQHYSCINFKQSLFIHQICSFEYVLYFSHMFYSSMHLLYIWNCFKKLWVSQELKSLRNNIRILSHFVCFIRILGFSIYTKICRLIDWARKRSRRIKLLWRGRVVLENQRWRYNLCTMSL